MGGSVLDEGRDAKLARGNVAEGDGAGAGVKINRTYIVRFSFLSMELS
jgi:hypothetical protein